MPSPMNEMARAVHSRRNGRLAEQDVASTGRQLIPGPRRRDRGARLGRSEQEEAERDRLRDARPGAASNARIRRSASSAMRCASARSSGVSLTSRSETMSTAESPGRLVRGGARSRRPSSADERVMQGRDGPRLVGIDVDPDVRGGGEEQLESTAHPSIACGGGQARPVTSCWRWNRALPNRISSRLDSSDAERGSCRSSSSMRIRVGWARARMASTPLSCSGEERGIRSVHAQKIQRFL